MDCVACRADSDVCYTTPSRVKICCVCIEAIMDTTSSPHTSYIYQKFAEGIRFVVDGTMKCQACSLSSHIFAEVAVCFRCCRDLNSVDPGPATKTESRVRFIEDTNPDTNPKDKKILHMAGADSSPSPSHNDSKSRQ